MLLFEAKQEIDSRIKHYYKSDLIDIDDLKPYVEALEIASKCIEAQMELAITIDDLAASDYKNDTYSGCLFYEVLQGVWWENIGKEDA